ncbi:shikimate kinase [Prochlorococcus sp. MIT 1307]|uniref:shikimate kinase n=1 Tax=Prochlorococcus sp. MIT 1307 TaxID=3096219 RepID=UPI002A756CFC|nr:shikimate kinase [Prochlorococcus sp. MIT 1307]
MSDSSTSSLVKERLCGCNLYLVGMMGAGKTSSGPYVAEALGYGFVDSDKVIEEVCHESISLIFENEGEKGFRTIEKEVLKAIGQRHSLVVATGGGLVTEPENWGVLHQGIVIWLDPGRERLFSRLEADPGERPLLKHTNSRTALYGLVDEREKFYLEADLHLKVADESPQQVAKQILQDLLAMLNGPEAPNAPQTTAR